MIPERLLLGPGPSPIAARVMRALGEPVLGHLDPELLRILDDVRHRLAEVFGARSDAFTFAVSGTGTSGMEAAVANVTAPGTRVTDVSCCTWCPDSAGSVRSLDVEHPSS